MIEKIFIPTVCRVDDQITYTSLPKELQKRVVFVVQAWERDQYKYDAEYLVLPEEITLDSHNALARTRKIIYDTGKNMKYAMFDDDIIFKRRNAKYWTGKSTMETSRRVSTHDDIIDMFNTFDTWLDEVTLCGCEVTSLPPTHKPYLDNTKIACAYWFNGKDFAKDLDDMHLTDVKVSEDVLLLLGLLSRGYKTRLSSEFLNTNYSIKSI